MVKRVNGGNLTIKKEDKMYPQGLIGNGCITTKNDSLYLKTSEEFWKFKQESKNQMDYQWHIEDLRARLDRAEFLLEKAYNLIEELQKTLIK